MYKTILKTMLFAGAAVMAVACGQKKGSAEAQQPAAMDAAEMVTTVTVCTAERRDVAQSETYPTTVQAFAVNNVVPQSGNRIKKIYAEIGDFVSKGQVLAVMDQSTLQQTKLKLANDSTELVRLKSLFLEGGLSKSDYESAEMAHKISRSQYENLLENTILRSPLTGVVTARNYDTGDMYAMSSPIYTVQQITPVKLLVAISEADYTKVKKGDSVDITADALPGKQFSGKVNRIYPTIDPASHTFTAEVLVSNADRQLRPGMYARAEVTFAVNSSIVVPDAAIIKQQGSGQRSVYVVNGEVAESRIVTLGHHFGSNYEILEGVEEGDLVVVKGHASLKSGSKVKVID